MWAQVRAERCGTALPRNIAAPKDAEDFPVFAKPGRLPASRPRVTSAASIHGFIYVIVHPGHTKKKFGFTSNLAGRLAAANTWSFSGSFRYLAYAPVRNMKLAEAMLHRMFSETRLSGEWFDADDEMARSMIDMVASRFPLTEELSAQLYANAHQVGVIA